MGYVALGAGINSSSTNPVTTSINQCLLKGSDVFVSNSPSALPIGEHTFTDVWWVHHNNVSYLFDQKNPPNLHVNNQPQSGSWSLIGTGSPDKISEDVFNLWIEHSHPPLVNDNYQYTVVPGRDLASFQKDLNRLLAAFMILENTPTIQAVAYRYTYVAIGIVFWQPGTLVASWTNITVDQPCIIVLNLAPTATVFEVSNPQQNTENNIVNFQISGEYWGSDCVYDGKNTHIKFTLPTGDEAGKSKSTECLNTLQKQIFNQALQ